MISYEIGIRLLVLGIRVAAVFNSKARLWVEGRRHWQERVNPTPDPSPTGRGDVENAATSSGVSSMERSTSPLPVGEGSGVGSKTLWLHAASLGEFEQGRPVIEAFREQFPGWRIVLTFFSPSGYEIRKNYPHADLVCYLPADTRRNARDFLDLIKPDVVIFVKYEFWANYLSELKKRSIPTLLVSALFRDNQPFFHWYGGFWRRMLGCFTHFFVQNEDSAKRLQHIGFQNTTVAGDTRVDRVLKIAEGVGENAVVAAFVGGGYPPLEGGRGEEILEIGSSSPLPPSKGGQPLTLPPVFI
ncbi:MAG TPA: glycosyltransferase N-terminal domain-containing protein, partial [Saprospiraceae bacterium]|nr:glycosyltransferase N-terminal domain-containing protein [Saprospiraceae bacterium]